MHFTEHALKQVLTLKFTLKNEKSTVESSVITLFLGVTVWQVDWHLWWAQDNTNWAVVKMQNMQCGR